MEVQVLYNTPHVIYLGSLIAIYFYLTGLSAGSFVVSVVSVIGGKTEYKPIGKIGAWLAPLLLIIAPITLIIDLEQPFRFWHLFYYLNFTSPITYGTFLLTIYPINCLIYLFFLYSGNERLTKVFGIIGIPLAVAVHGYTGFILALGKGRALWSTALMPTLFLVSAMVSGIALVIIVAVPRYLWLNRRGVFATEEDRQRELNLIYWLGKFMGGLIICDLFLVANDILVLLTSHLEALEVAKLILKGPFAPMFIGVEIILGGFVPIFILFYPRWGRTLKGVTSASVLTLVGVLAMRIVVVIAGQYIPLH